MKPEPMPSVVPLRADPLAVVIVTTAGLAALATATIADEPSRPASVPEPVDAGADAVAAAGAAAGRVLSTNAAVPAEATVAATSDPTSTRPTVRRARGRSAADRRGGCRWVDPEVGPGVGVRVRLERRRDGRRKAGLGIGGVRSRVGVRLLVHASGLPAAPEAILSPAPVRDDRNGSLTGVPRETQRPGPATGFDGSGDVPGSTADRRNVRGHGFRYLDHERTDRLGEADVASLDMAPWAAPELTGLHRVPMHSVPHEDRVLLDGEWRFQLLPAADAAATDAWGTITVPGSWAMQDKGDLPQYTNIVMPFPDLPPAVPAANPTGLYVRSFEVPERWAGRRIVLHIGAAESVAIVRVNDHDVGIGKDSHLASEFEIGDVLVPGTNTPRGPRRQVVRRQLHRGPGRVVARRHHPLGLPVLDRPDLSRRHQGDRRARRRSHDRARSTSACRSPSTGASPSTAG